MKVSGEILKASIVVGRDSTEMEMRIRVTGGDADAKLATSSYCGQLVDVEMRPAPDPAPEPVEAPAEASADDNRYSPSPWVKGDV